MSVESIVGIVALTIGGIGSMLGAAWWMSALYSRVTHIQENTANTSTKLDTLTERMDGDLHEVRRDITDIQIRVVKLEGTE